LSRAVVVTVQGRVPLIVGSRTLLSKARRDESDVRPAPFPYETRNFDVIGELFDRVNPRMNANSRVIMLDGAHAVGKTDLANQLAEEFDMKVFGFPSMSDWFYKDHYGVSLADYAGYLNPINRPWDEKDFSRNPTGPLEGACDRYLAQNWINIYENYLNAISHMLNTGQGVIVEGNPWSDYAHFEAAFNQGWVERTTRTGYKAMQYRSIYYLQRPHVIIYLDAPAEAVMKNIKARGNPWDKNSPVWTNKRYLNDIYNEKKRRYLKKHQLHSHVLVYDWATPGDLEVVVDDLEKLELDMVDEYDELLRDWTKVRSETHSTILRTRYCNMKHRNDMLDMAKGGQEWIDCENMQKSPVDAVNLEQVMSYMPSARFQPGVNAAMGDKNIWANCNRYTGMLNDTKYGTYSGVRRALDYFNGHEYLDPYPLPSPDEAEAAETK